ncbi:hypothetical protein AKJ08_1737 [Vulgatibacter incomptus]|uniref:Uncharacterized protein n=1 Tax=Vulgatibacter incomptus TaxID=1391653 RepID=A0A0K1PCV1_9BACT|nr:hypothetical protein AKJ08_1737 [Vulgatibacter incomptus]
MERPIHLSSGGLESRRVPGHIASRNGTERFADPRTSDCRRHLRRRKTGAGSVSKAGRPRPSIVVESAPI